MPKSTKDGVKKKRRSANQIARSKAWFKGLKEKKAAEKNEKTDDCCKKVQLLIPLLAVLLKTDESLLYPRTWLDSRQPHLRLIKAE